MSQIVCFNPHLSSNLSKVRVIKSLTVNVILLHDVFVSLNLLSLITMTTDSLLSRFFSLHHQQLSWTHTAARRRRDPVTMTITSILVSGN